MIFLQLARGECVLAQELLDDATDLANELMDKVRTMIIRITDLITALTMDEADETQDDTAVVRALEAREIENIITETSARLRFHFTEAEAQDE